MTEVDWGALMQFITSRDPIVWVLVGGGVVAYVAYLWVTTNPNRGMYGHKDPERIAELERENSTVWATRKDLKDLLTPRGQVQDPRVQRLGFLRSGKGEQVSTTPMASVLVVAPTGSNKSAAYVVPDLLLHGGPALVTSVKNDVLRLTRDHRGADGKPVWVFDPSRSTGDTARWSPLASVRSWADALDAARWLQDSSKADKGTGEDREFWDANARKVLAPLIWLAAKQGKQMSYVTSMAARISAEADTLGQLMQRLGGPAYDYWVSYRTLAEKTRSSVEGTLFTVLEAWSHPMVQSAVDVSQSSMAGDVLNVRELFSKEGTLYLIAPASQQALFTPVFETLVNAVTMEVERMYSATGRTVDPPLFVCLDEAANIAPVRNLDKLASAGAQMGIKLKSVWQDEGQIEERYGRDRARTITSNHVNKVYLPGISDRATLANLADLIPSTLTERASTSVDASGRRSSSSQLVNIQVAPPSWLRELPTGEAIVISRNYKPMHLATRPWYEDKEIRRLINPRVADEFDRYYAKPSRKRLGRGQQVKEGAQQ